MKLAMRFIEKFEPDASPKINELDWALGSPWNGDLRDTLEARLEYLSEMERNREGH